VYGAGEAGAYGFARLRLAAPFACGLFAAGLAMSGCQTPAAAPAAPPVEREARFAPRVPDVADQTAAQLAAAALAGAPTDTELALKRMEAIDTVLEAADEPATGLAPVSHDLANATLDGERAYRSATLALLERDDLDPATQERLALATLDDPLVRADARIRDARMIEFGRAFNAVVDPVARSVMTLSFAPYRLARALLEYGLDRWKQDSLTLQRRQALSEWKDFIARNPEAPEVAELRPKVEAAEERFRRTQRDQALRTADDALARDDVRSALVFADRALRIVPEDPKALERRDTAAERLLELRARQSRSLEAAPASVDGGEHGEQARPLAVALLLPSGAIEPAARELLERDPGGALADEARFALAVADGEAGRETPMWDGFEAIADEDPGRSNMARHALAETHDPRRNAWAAFRSARWRDRRDRALWLLVGPFYHGARERRLPDTLEWALDAPQIAQAMMSTPIRLIQMPWVGALPSAQAVASSARDYLTRYPGGEHAAEVRDWLTDYECDRGNWIGALEIAEEAPDADLRELDRMRRLAGAQALDASSREENRDLRIGMLRLIPERFAGTPAADVAERRLRDELQTATEQRIRISRGFLLENPRVAGPHGLALAPGLLDGDFGNGELHAEGVALIGGRELEICTVAPGGDLKAPPQRTRETISAAHLARLVAEVEEADLRNSLLDRDDVFAPDAQRDVFFERARLGLTDEVDRRATSTSQYAYLGMRERYGLVRARESILPFELVFSGSLSDFSLGAAPRMKTPAPTPDAILYK
jgi:hypothetical protein